MMACQKMMKITAELFSFIFLDILLKNIQRDQTFCISFHSRMNDKIFIQINERLRNALLDRNSPKSRRHCLQHPLYFFGMFLQKLRFFFFIFGPFFFSAGFDDLCYITIYSIDISWSLRLRIIIAKRCRTADPYGSRGCWHLHINTEIFLSFCQRGCNFLFQVLQLLLILPSKKLFHIMMKSSFALFSCDS